MQGGDQKTGRDANTFRDIIILVTLPIIKLAIAFSKNHNQPWGINKMRLVWPGADRLQRLDPFIMIVDFIKVPFFLLGRSTYLRLHPIITNECKMPWLMVCTAWCKACCLDAVFDNLARHRLCIKITDAVPLAHDLEMGSSSRGHVLIAWYRPVAKRQCFI